MTRRTAITRRWPIIGLTMLSSAAYAQSIGPGGGSGISASSSNTFTAPQTFSGQIISTGSPPTIASGACGATSNGAVVAGSTNQSGNITIGAASTTTCTVSWSSTLTAPNACVFFPANAAAAAAGTTVARVGAPSSTGVVLTGSVLAGANYSYICL